MTLLDPGQTYSDHKSFLIGEVSFQGWPELIVENSWGTSFWLTFPWLSLIPDKLILITKACFRLGKLLFRDSWDLLLKTSSGENIAGPLSTTILDPGQADSDYKGFLIGEVYFWGWPELIVGNQFREKLSESLSYDSPWSRTSWFWLQKLFDWESFFFFFGGGRYWLMKTSSGTTFDSTFPWFPPSLRSWTSWLWWKKAFQSKRSLCDDGRNWLLKSFSDQKFGNRISFKDISDLIDKKCHFETPCIGTLRYCQRTYKGNANKIRRAKCAGKL